MLISKQRRPAHLRGKLLVGVPLQDLLLQRLVVVDLAVDGDTDGAVLVEQRLVARGGVNDGQALVRHERIASLVQAGLRAAKREKKRRMLG